jgi:uncharacterized protein YabE (DUF348 family)
MTDKPVKKFVDIKRPPKFKKKAITSNSKKTALNNNLLNKKLPKKQKIASEKKSDNVSKKKFWSKGMHRHPFMVPVFTFLVLFFVSMIGIVGMSGQTIGANDSHVVRVSIEGNTSMVPTRAKTVKEFLEKVQIDVNEGDVIEPALESEIDQDDFRLNVYKARPVTIIDGESKTQTLSAAKTPRAVVEQAGVQVYPEDAVNLDKPSERILEDQTIGETLVIDRATPTYLNLYGTQVDLRTRAKTVGDLLKEKDIKLQPGDTVQPSPETVLAANTQVFVTRNGTQIASAEEEIPMPEEIVEDGNLSFGATAIRQKGSPGKKIVTYQIETKNGVEVGRKPIQEVIAVQPVKQIVARGKAYSVPEDKSGLLTAAGIPLSDYPYVNHIISKESGWCATKWQGQVGYCPGYYTEIHSPSSGYGYGLCQSTPAIKMASAGADWQNNPVTQLKWCSGYAIGRYGSWENAYNTWLRQNWW